jgi:hypothetical protein
MEMSTIIEDTATVIVPQVLLVLCEPKYSEVAPNGAPVLNLRYDINTIL